MISTKDVPTGGTGSIPKTLSPGNAVIKINSIALEKNQFEEGSYHVNLQCEGVDQGPEFEGFFIDKDNESLGKHKGQVGRIKASEWAYHDKELKEVTISRDMEILKFIKNVCIATGSEKWFDANDEKHKTIESFVSQFDKDAPFKDVYLNVCIGGREYVNKNGYTTHDLFFPKFSRAGVPFESENAQRSKVYKFSADDHIRVKKVKTTEAFEPTSSAGGDFDLG